MILKLYTRYAHRVLDVACGHIYALYTLLSPPSIDNCHERRWGEERKKPSNKNENSWRKQKQWTIYIFADGCNDRKRIDETNKTKAIFIADKIFFFFFIFCISFSGIGYIVHVHDRSSSVSRASVHIPLMCYDMIPNAQCPYKLVFVNFSQRLKHHSKFKIERQTRETKMPTKDRAQFYSVIQCKACARAQ